MRASLQMPFESVLGKAHIQSQPHKAALKSWGCGWREPRPSHSDREFHLPYCEERAVGCTQLHFLWREAFSAGAGVGGEQAAEGGDGMTWMSIQGLLKEQEMKEAKGWGRFPGYMCINSWEFIWGYLPQALFTVVLEMTTGTLEFRGNWSFSAISFPPSRPRVSHMLVYMQTEWIWTLIHPICRPWGPGKKITDRFFPPLFSHFSPLYIK